MEIKVARKTMLGKLFSGQSLRFTSQWILHIQIRHLTVGSKVTPAGKLEHLQDGFMETQKPLETASSSERGGRREPAESARKQQRNSDLRLLTVFHVAGSHSYFWFIILHRPEDFRKSAFFFFSQFLANAQAELCLLKRKNYLLGFWHRTGFAWAIKSTKQDWPAAVGVPVARVLAVSSSPGSGQNTKHTILLSFYNPAVQGPTWPAQHMHELLLLWHPTQKTFLQYHSYRHKIFHSSHFWRNGFYCLFTNVLSMYNPITSATGICWYTPARMSIITFRHRN